MTAYTYFRPEYVGKFQCDGTTCGNNCCELSWNIFIDAATYENYSQHYPQIAEHIKFDDAKKQYVIVHDERGHCPFLTEKKLCRLQLEHGADFLSATCALYPRITYNFGKFLEQSMTLTCPTVAEMALFGREPLKFELVTVPTKKLGLNAFEVPEKFREHMIDIQVAEISILQERTLTIDQRLIVLGFFLERLEKISADELNIDALIKLIVAYESKNFLASEVPSMLASVHFNALNFVGLMLKIFESLYSVMHLESGRRFVNAVAETLQLKPDENNSVSAASVVDRYENLAAERKNFSASYATFLENYLVNNLFTNCYPWRFLASIMQNYAMFAATYKVFDLLTFAAVSNGLGGKDDLLKLVEFFTTQTDHMYGFREKIFDNIKHICEPVAIMNAFLEP